MNLTNKWSKSCVTIELQKKVCKKIQNFDVKLTYKPKFKQTLHPSNYGDICSWWYEYKNKKSKLKFVNPKLLSKS